MNVIQAFDYARSQLNNPWADIVYPFDKWTNAVGLEYDEQYDAIRDINGDIITDLWQYWEVKPIPILPNAANSQAQEMFMAGMTPTGNVTFYTLPEYEDIVMNAFRVVINDIEYNVSFVTREPINDPEFITVGVTLWKQLDSTKL